MAQVNGPVVGLANMQTFPVVETGTPASDPWWEAGFGSASRSAASQFPPTIKYGQSVAIKLSIAAR